jgi:hypothetical protein
VKVTLEVALSAKKESDEVAVATLAWLKANEASDDGVVSFSQEQITLSPEKSAHHGTANGANAGSSKRSANHSFVQLAKEFLWKIIQDDMSPCKDAFTQEHFTKLAKVMQNRKYGPNGEAKFAWEFWECKEDKLDTWPTPASLGCEMFSRLSKEVGGKMPQKNAFTPTQSDDGITWTLPSFGETTVQPTSSTDNLATAYTEGLGILASAIIKTKTAPLDSSATIFHFERGEKEAAGYVHAHIQMQVAVEGSAEPKTYSDLLAALSLTADGKALTRFKQEEQKAFMDKKKHLVFTISL